MNPPAWWRRAVVYQVYIRSFADGNGDGTGDLAGLRSRLPYLSDLGIDAIWINPWYPSPLLDGGYDVADYRSIDPRFGTLAEAEEFIAEAHALGIRVLADIVPNHTSWEHEWFKAALAAGPGSPERDRYVFKDGRGPDGAEPPNDWAAVFGGPAWTRVEDGQWYLHLFDISQPDLNWENPEVADEFVDIFRFWCDRGVDGFRIDVAHSLIKDQTFRDSGGRATPADRNDLIDHPHWDRDEVHDIIRRWRATIDEYDDRMMVAEAWVAPSRLPLYLRPDEYQQSFNFDLLETPWDAGSFRKVIQSSVDAANAVGASSTWVLSNHDVMRHATRYGLPNGTDWRAWPATGPHDLLDVELGWRRARAAALMTLSLPGSLYLYQGEELGLPEVWDLPDEVLDDPTWERSGHTQRGRDGCRVPVPWAADGPSYGFGEGESWLPQPAVFGALAAGAQEGVPGSMLELYRQAIALRNAHLVDDEEIEFVDLGPDVLAYKRGSGILVAVNISDTEIDLPAGEVLLRSLTDSDGSQLQVDEAVWIQPT